MSRSRKVEPEHVGGLLEKLLRSRGVLENVERAAVIPQWDEMVGVEISRVATPVGFDNSTLFVEVRSSAWLMELQMMERRMLIRLNEERRRGKFERIVFRLAEGG